MRVGVKDVKLPLGIALDKWEVLLGGGLACIVVGVAAKTVRFLVWIGIALIIVWVVTVFLVNLGLLKANTGSEPSEGGGAAPTAGTSKESGEPTQPTP
jgi:hypothetical protein